MKKKILKVKLKQYDKYFAELYGLISSLQNRVKTLEDQGGIPEDIKKRLLALEQRNKEDEGDKDTPNEKYIVWIAYNKSFLRSYVYGKSITPTVRVEEALEFDFIDDIKRLLKEHTITSYQIFKIC